MMIRILINRLIIPETKTTNRVMIYIQLIFPEPKLNLLMEPGYRLQSNILLITGRLPISPRSFLTYKLSDRDSIMNPDSPSEKT